MALCRWFLTALSMPLLLAALPPNAGATAPELPLSTRALDRGELKLGLGGAYLSTGANFDANGNKLSLPGLGSFQTVQAGLFGQYGLTQELTAVLATPFVYNTATGPGTGLALNQATVVNSSGGPGDVTAGVRYEPWHEPVRTSFDLLVQFPLYSRLLKDQWATLIPNGDVPLGTGVTEFTGLVRVAVPLAYELDALASIGVTARTGGFSNLVPYQAGFRYEQHHGLIARLLLKGAFTASNDQFTGVTPQPNDRSSAVSAQSQIYNAINPAYTAVTGALGTFIGDSFFVTVAAELPFLGKNVPAGATFTGVAGIDLGGLTPRPLYESSNRGFQQYYLAAKVIRVNSQLRQILIDRGTDELIHKGELLDIFEPDRTDASYGDTVARARVLEVGPTKAKLQVLEYFKETTIQEGFVVRRPVR